MYESYFRLTRRPFSSAANTEHYYPAATIEKAREALALNVERGSGPALVIGPVGTGKTLVCHLLADHFRRDLSVCMLASTRLCTRRTLLQAVLYELGLPYRNLEEGELRIAMIDHLSSDKASPRGTLLLVDEADSLSLMLLEEIRMITNLVQDGQPRVRLVLAGGPRLEERLADPRMESLNQRIVCRYYLQRYAADETACYLQARITASGGNPDQIFTPRAMQAIHRATTGVPRLVNQLCEHAMILAAVGGHEQLDGPDIEEAWADLQQLPVPIPHNDVRDRAAPEKAIIEFGPLQQDDGPTPETSDFSETANLDPETRLDDIQRGIAAASQDAPFDSMDGSQCAEPELRDAQSPFSPPPGDARDDDGDIPGVPGASNPFDEEFEEEEVVLDRYASPDALARRSEHQVGCGVSAVLAERLTIAHPGLRLAQAPADEPSPDMPPTHAKGSRVSEVIVQFSGLMDPAADPVLPELFDEMMLPNGSGAPRSQPDVRAATATDGSDAAQYDPSGSDRKTTVGELEYQELATSVGSEPASTHRTFGKLFTRMRQR